MKSIKKYSSVYSFLDKSGILENGTGEAIQQAKKQYWKEYRRKYNKVKRRENKPFQICFDFKEAAIIIEKANKYHSSPTNYIKQSALANGRNIPDPVAAGEIRELVILHHNALRTLEDENQLQKPIADRLLSQASQIETRVLDFISLFK